MKLATSIALLLASSASVTNAINTVSRTEEKETIFIS